MTEHQALTNVRYTKTRLNSQSDVLSGRVYSMQDTVSGEYIFRILQEYNHMIRWILEISNPDNY
jgi:hypothetical protein